MFEGAYHSEYSHFKYLYVVGLKVTCNTKDEELDTTLFGLFSTLGYPAQVHLYCVVSPEVAGSEETAKGQQKRGASKDSYMLGSDLK